MRWLLALLLCGVLVGCLGDDGPPAEETAVRDATVQLLAQVENDQYADVWESLHPAYQAVIPQDLLVDCGERFPAAFVAYEIDDVEMDEYLADEIGTIDAWLVDMTFELVERFADPSGAPGMSNRTLRFVQAGDAWRWFPATGELLTFKDGNCGLPWPGGASEARTINHRASTN